MDPMEKQGNPLANLPNPCRGVCWATDASSQQQLQHARQGRTSDRHRCRPPPAWHVGRDPKCSRPPASPTQGVVDPAHSKAAGYSCASSSAYEQQTTHTNGHTVCVSGGILAPSCAWWPHHRPRPWPSPKHSAKPRWHVNVTLSVHGPYKIHTCTAHPCGTHEQAVGRQQHTAGTRSSTPGVARTNRPWAGSNIQERPTEGGRNPLVPPLPLDFPLGHVLGPEATSLAIAPHLLSPYAGLCCCCLCCREPLRLLCLCQVVQEAKPK